jgi:hypothetical protein
MKQREAGEVSECLSEKIIKKVIASRALRCVAIYDFFFSLILIPEA